MNFPFISGCLPQFPSQNGSWNRSAISGGNEKVMVLVVLGMIVSLLSSLTRILGGSSRPCQPPQGPNMIVE